MTLEQLEERVTKLEQQMAELTSFMRPKREVGRDDWKSTIGMFKDTTLWDRAFELGREYREQDQLKVQQE